MAMYYNGKKVRNLYYNGKCITRLALGKEMTRLVEGDDFVRAEWLKVSSGNPIIRFTSEYNTDPNAFLETTYICNYTNGNVDMIIGLGNADNNNGIRVFNLGQHTIIDFHKRVNGELSSKRVTIYKNDITTPRYIYVSLNAYKIDNESLTNINYGAAFDSNFNQKFSMIQFNEYNNNLKVSSTRLRTNNVTYNLIPCRLLRPIPAALDANGKARQAGECGMYDSVSGLFYGNVGSGAFTVSDN